MKKKTKTNPQIVIAVVGLIGTILTALLTSPVLIEFIKAKSSTSTPTNIPTLPTVTPTPDAIYTSEKGELRHDGEGGVEWKMAGSLAKNFIAEATFINPYSANEHKWDINIFFRRAKGNLYRIGISSENNWSFGVELPEWKPIKSDTVFDKSRFNFKTDKGESNVLRIIVYETTGCFYLNDKFVSELDLSDLNQIGDIGIAIGSYSNSEQKGAITSYENFSIYKINDFSGCP